MSEKNKVKDFRTAIDLQALMGADSKGKLPKKIDLMVVGNFKHPLYGDFEITRIDIDKFVENFQNGLRAKGSNGDDKSLPINIAHNRDGEAAGWIDDVRRNDDTLEADVSWTSLGKEKIKDRLYRYISPEWHFEYRHPETAELFTHVLVGAGLTNIPYFSKLKPLTSSENNVILFTVTPNMKLEDIVKKDLEELSDEEREFLIENKEELSEDQSEKFASVLDDNQEDEDDQEPPTEDDEDEDPNEASDENITLTASEYKDLQDTARKVKTMEFKEELQGMTASEKEAGKLTPALRDKAVKLMVAMDSSELKLFREFLKGLPKIAKFGGEQGSEENSNNDVADKIDALVTEYRKDNKEASYRQALTAVKKANPELAKEMNNSGLAKEE